MTETAPSRGRGRPRIPRQIKVVLIRREHPDVRKLAKVLIGLYAHVRTTQEQEHE